MNSTLNATRELTWPPVGNHLNGIRGRTTAIRFRRFSLHIGGALIHLVLVAGLVVLVTNLLSGRRRAVRRRKALRVPAPVGPSADT